MVVTDICPDNNGVTWQQTESFGYEKLHSFLQVKGWRYQVVTVSALREDFMIWYE